MSNDIRELRLLVEHEGDLKRLCKLAFTKSDASIYVIPYAAGGRYFYGDQTLEEREVEKTFDFTEQLSTSERIPKLSIQRGRVHVEADSARAGPLWGPSLPHLRGEHVATVTADSFAGLTRHEQTPRLSGAERDFVLLADRSVESGRVAIYVNGKEPRFVRSCELFLTLARPTLTGPLYVGLGTIGQLPLGGSDSSGITVIGGWNPRQVITDVADSFLFVRGA